MSPEPVLGETSLGIPELSQPISCTANSTSVHWVLVLPKPGSSWAVESVLCRMISAGTLLAEGSFVQALDELDLTPSALEESSKCSCKHLQVRGGIGSGYFNPDIP